MCIIPPYGHVGINAYGEDRSYLSMCMDVYGCVGIGHTCAWECVAIHAA